MNDRPTTYAASVIIINQTFVSLNAITSPAVAAWSLESVSASPTSSTIRSWAISLSSSVKPRVLCGRSGRTTAAVMARSMVTEPSIQNSHLQAAWPRTPCMFERTPAPTRAEKALEMRLPQNRMAFLMVSSRRVYHFERISSAPGRKAASTKPRKKRTSTMPLKS